MGVNVMSILTWIILGLVAGFIASKLVNKHGEGFVWDVVLGVVGALAGGFIFKTNEPVFPRRTFPALWRLITGSAASSGLAALWLADEDGIPPGFGPACVSGASANASANAMAINTMF